MYNYIQCRILNHDDDNDDAVEAIKVLIIITTIVTDTYICNKLIKSITQLFQQANQ